MSKDNTSKDPKEIEEQGDGDDPTRTTTVLRTLAIEYQQLSKQQAQLEEWIQQLEEEEEALKLALDQATAIPQKPQHQRAIERLEQALLNDSDSSSDDDDDDT